ncbi:MAG: hypothetical protein C0483_11330 [Pirellula sp.]|nr:hypothetical protein [Pirellula sp.]
MTPVPISRSEVISALLRNDPEALRRAIEKSNGNVSDTEPLFLAAECEAELMELLLRHGWTPNVHAEQFLDTPLMRSAKEGNKDAVAILLNFGADIALVDRNGHNALLTTICGRWQVARPSRLLANTSRCGN